MQETNMTEFLTYVDRIVDFLIAALPLGTLDYFSILAILLADSHGRFIFFGIVIFLVMLAAWVVMWLIQKLFTPKRLQSNQRLANSHGNVVSNQQSDSVNSSDEDVDRFYFFRKPNQMPVSDDTAALVAIEQEMLAVRQLFADGHIIEEVYVSETRRLYSKAKALQS